jgi:ribosomal protein S7
MLHSRRWTEKPGKRLLAAKFVQDAALVQKIKGVTDCPLLCVLHRKIQAYLPILEVTRAAVKSKLS